MAYDKFRNEGRITEDIEFTTNKLICYLKVDHESHFDRRTKGTQNRSKLRRLLSMKAFPRKKNWLAFLISPISLL